MYEHYEDPPLSTVSSMLCHADDLTTCLMVRMIDSPLPQLILILGLCSTELQKTGTFYTLLLQNYNIEKCVRDILELMIILQKKHMMKHEHPMWDSIIWSNSNQTFFKIKLNSLKLSVSKYKE